MDCSKTGKLIYNLRKQKNLTQKQLADMMNISDKAVSKWERGFGLPDVSLLKELSDILEVNIEKILEGELDLKDAQNGNLKKMKYYICPQCGNIVMSLAEADISCCGRKMEAEIPKKADDENKIEISTSEDDYYITSDHEMTKDHYISFVTLMTGDKMHLIKQYPQWNLQCRIPKRYHGTILWYCTKHGLFFDRV